MRNYLKILIKLTLLQNWRKIAHSKGLLYLLIIGWCLVLLAMHYILSHAPMNSKFIEDLRTYEIFLWFGLYLFFLGSGVGYGMLLLIDERRPIEKYLLSLPAPLFFFSLVRIVKGVIANGSTVMFAIPLVFFYKYLCHQNIWTSLLAIVIVFLLFLLAFLQGFLIALLALIKLPYTLRVMLVGGFLIISTVLTVIFTVFFLPRLDPMDMLSHLKKYSYLPFFWAYQGNFLLLISFSILTLYLCLIFSAKGDRYESEFEADISADRGLNTFQRWNYITSNFIKTYIPSTNPVFVFLKKDLLDFSRNISRVLYIIPPLIIPFIFLATGKVEPIRIFFLYYIPSMIVESFTIPSIVGEGANISIYKIVFAKPQLYLLIKILSGLIITWLISSLSMIIYSAVSNCALEVITMRTLLISLATISAVVSGVGVGILCADFEEGQQNVNINDRIGKPSYLVFKFFSVPIIFTIIDNLFFLVETKSLGVQALILFFFIMATLPPFFFFRAGELRLKNFE